MGNLLNNSEKSLSFEVFPPKKEEDFPNAFDTLKQLSLLNPDFISVTYGAGGSKSGKTIEIASYIYNTLHVNTISHITCVGNKKEDIDSVVAQLKNNNIYNILALRGDRPSYMTDEQFFSRDFLHASEMITYLKGNKDLHIAGACYPEKHYEAESLSKDLLNLKHKVDCGAECLISQLFFDNDTFYRFYDEARKLDINVPILAGIMPITTSNQLGTTVSLSGSSVPKKLADIIATYGDNKEDMRKAGIEFAIDQILDLKKHGMEHIHIYSMNKWKMTTEIVNAI